MHRRAFRALVVATTVVGGLLAGLPSRANAREPNVALTYGWVGSSVNHDADNHSWTDGRNWSPEGVPGDGDAVNIVAPMTEPCDVHVDGVPAGLELSNLLLSTSTTKGCHASLSGGSIRVLSTMEWTGGTLDTPIVMSPGSGLLIGDEPVHVIEWLRQPLTVLGGGLTLASAHIRMHDGGSIRLDAAANTTVTHATDIKDLRADRSRPSIVGRGSLRVFSPLQLTSVVLRQDGPVELSDGAVIAHDSAVTLGAGTQLHGTAGQQAVVKLVGSTVSIGSTKGDPAVIDDVTLRAAGNDFDLAAGAELEITGGRRGTLSGAMLRGGGTLSVAAPMNVQGSFSVADASVLRLQPGGALDGTSVYTGIGSFEWLGGELSGNDIGFALTRLSVGGATTKTINQDHGITSFVQALNPVTFTPGTKALPNLLDMNGNSFLSFVAETLQRNVEIKDGDFVSSVASLTVDPGTGGVVRMDDDVRLFSSGPLTLASGRLDLQGDLMVNGGRVDVRPSASLRLAGADHPLFLNAGTLTGGGEIVGDIVNSGGVFDPAATGADAPLTLIGSYQQTSGGRLILDFTAGSQPFSIDGSVTVAGVVSYQNAAGFRPSFGAEKVVLTAGATLTWTPNCEETTGTRSGKGHWDGDSDQGSVVATFVRGSSGLCSR